MLARGRLGVVAAAEGASFTSAHTITFNYDTGFAYVNDSNTCSGGPRTFDLSNLTNATFVGCVASDRYTHDSQCVTYRGPNSRFTGRELCLNSTAPARAPSTSTAAPPAFGRRPSHCPRGPR
jgi:hypothetical protein